ncbi:MAG: ribbon-helix-helix protein, CopG family [Verrucomicrobia bacterium]|nr:ribbon-helix-helix protein, CopG family [Verrucomicrobiota bacterium]
MSYSLTRTSMALDAWTVQSIKELSEKWSISKSEVMRRAVRQLKEKADKEEHAMDPLQALNWLQQGGGLVADEADQFRADLKAEREERKYWWES